MRLIKQTLCLLVTAATIGLPALAADSASGGIEKNTMIAENGASFRKSTGKGSCGARSRGCGRRGGLHLSLSDDQLEKMSSLKTQYFSATAPQKAELMSLKRQERDLITKAGSDRNQIMSLQDKINGLKSQLATSSLKYKLDKFALLTPEQQQKIRHQILVGQAFGGHHRRGHRA